MDNTAAVAMAIIHSLTYTVTKYNAELQLKIISQIVLTDNFKVVHATLMLRFLDCNIYNVVF